MTEVQRITVTEAREKVLADQALLVCAYANDASFARYQLDGAISLAEFKARVDLLPKDREIIFYCD